MKPKPESSDEPAPNEATCLSITNDRLLAINEVSELTGLTVGTLYHFVSQRRIPVVRLSKRCIRFRLSSLERWLDELGEDPTTRNKR